MSSVPFHLSKRANHTGEQPISYFMQQAIENPGLISLAAGLVDPETLPADAIRTALDEILSDPSSAQAALQYGTTQGYTPLREKILAHVLALDGVTLTLLGTTAAGTGTGSSANLTVASDTGAITTNIGAFVTAYNALATSVASLGSFDVTTSTAGPMLGDALLSGIQNEIRSTLYSIVNSGSSTYSSLASVGITTKSDGTLSLNSSKLQTALTSDPGAVSALFSGTNGIATKLNTQLTADLASGGSIDSRSKTLVKKEDALTQETKDLDKQMAALTASLTQQYATLNTLLSSLQSTSAALTQQLSSLPVVQQKTS